MTLQIPRGGHTVIAGVAAATLTLLGAAGLTVVLEAPLTQALAAEPAAGAATVRHPAAVRSNMRRQPTQPNDGNQLVRGACASGTADPYRAAAIVADTGAITAIAAAEAAAMPDAVAAPTATVPSILSTPSMHAPAMSAGDGRYLANAQTDEGWRLEMDGRRASLLELP